MDIDNKLHKKAFQEKANCPLADRCMGYIVNKIEHVWSGAPYVGEDPRLGGGVPCDSPMPSRALVTWEPPVNRPTDMTENITFSHPVANGKNYIRALLDP